MYPHEILEPIVLWFKRATTDVRSRIDQTISKATRCRWQQVFRCAPTKLDPRISKILAVLEVAGLELWWGTRCIRTHENFQQALIAELLMQANYPQGERDFLERCATADCQPKLHTFCRAASICGVNIEIRGRGTIDSVQEQGRESK